MLDTNLDAFLRAVPINPMPKIEKAIKKRTMRAASIMHEYVTTHTPVWKGTALANYFWTVGAPYAGSPRAPAGTFIDPGPTNAMVIGTEPRFAINKALADAEFSALSFGAFDVIYLTNAAPHFEQIEYGLPPRDGLRARAPQGVMRVGALFTEARLKAEGL